MRGGGMIVYGEAGEIMIVYEEVKEVADVGVHTPYARGNFSVSRKK